jgi:hypothetical protein
MLFMQGGGGLLSEQLDPLTPAKSLDVVELVIFRFFMYVFFLFLNTSSWENGPYLVYIFMCLLSFWVLQDILQNMLPSPPQKKSKHIKIWTRYGPFSQLDVFKNKKKTYIKNLKMTNSTTSKDFAGVRGSSCSLRRPPPPCINNIPPPYLITYVK